MSADKTTNAHIKLSLTITTTTVTRFAGTVFTLSVSATIASTSTFVIFHDYSFFVLHL